MAAGDSICIPPLTIVGVSSDKDPTVYDTPNWQMLLIILNYGGNIMKVIQIFTVLDRQASIHF